MTNNKHLVQYCHLLTSWELSHGNYLCILTNSMDYGTRRFNAAFTRAIQ